MAFSVVETTRFRRDFEGIARRNRDVLHITWEVKGILSADPYNLSHQFKIKKLTDISFGDGQWRIRIKHYRIRYDISGKEVILHSIKPRKDAYH
ncbi:MAG: hypothetical protein HYV67_00115 [Candidatus Taylorbacteria bacterium]|nr:hypothetical protein [Candidatus Vogelbacteria bacterium]MBI2475637.1 hypothetical protein [Candidatus Taylorbacteria bacterium]